MKRLILRIAALGTVVVLGLIAIAQAQRGGDDSPLGAAEPGPGKQPPAETAPPERLAERAITGARLLSEGGSNLPGGNPLRGDARHVSANAKIPPAKGLPSDAPAPMADAELALEKGSARRPPADPFGLQARGGGPSADPAFGRASVVEKGIPEANEIPDASALGAPPRRLAEGEMHYPQLPSPPATAGPPGTVPLVPPLAEPPVTDRYPDFQRETSEIREPATLKAADPFAAPTRLPAPNATAPNTFVPPAAGVASTEATVAPEGTGQPGSKHLEGPQSPTLTIQKFAPPQIQVGQPATFRVTVRNAGTVAASGVEVRDRVPQGTRLLDTSPRATLGARGELVWTLGTIKPGEESQVEIQLMPVGEGEIGSVATVSFCADASARTIATKPELVLRTSGPGKVLIGEKVALSVEVSNPGSGTATGVVLQEHVPAGLQHPAGSELEYEIGDLPPGESRKLELTMTATRAGPTTNLLSARGDASLQTEDRLNLEVIAPLLEIAMEGPQKRYLEREAVYKLSVANPGTAPAEQVELVAYLPGGLKFVSANNAGHYEETNRTVHWRLEELPVDETGTVELVTMPVEAGQQKIRLRGTANKGLAAEDEQQVSIEGIAAIKFEVVDVTDPIEVGGETMYEVRVVNQGSKAATNVRLAVILPAQMQAVAAEGPTRHAVEGSRVLFDGLSRLAPKADTSYRIRVKALQPGDLRFRVQLMTDEMRTPVTKEESTRVYSDE